MTVGMSPREYSWGLFPPPSNRTDTMDNVHDKRRIKLEDLEGIPLYSGRPDRSKIIGQDDITNIIIDLHQTADVNQFIERI